MPEKLSDNFGLALAILLADKIGAVHSSFPRQQFIATAGEGIEPLSLTQRVKKIADTLNTFLPAEYPVALNVLRSIMGEDNPGETGMFKHYYWLMPVGKFIELYGIDHPELSLDAIEELTKRNTGEYAIRPFIRKYPDLVLARMKSWALSSNFHLRRLASEGLRPKLPWAAKLDLFIVQPQPVFDILDLLKEDEVMFVKRSVANNLADYLKLNPAPAEALLERWSQLANSHTDWIIRHATRNRRKAEAKMLST